MRAWSLMMAAIIPTGIPGAGAQTSSVPSIRPAPASVVPDKAPPPATQGASPCGDVEALPAAVAKALVARVATRENFYPDFVSSVARFESGFVSTGVSDKGAYGLMQLTRDTAQRFAVDLCDPPDNVLGGVRFLRHLHQRYRNPLFILAAYNAGEETLQKHRGVPPYPETLRFVANVLNDFYTWPALTPPPQTAARKIPPAASGVATRTGASPDSKSSAPESWREGFVMHVE